MDSSLQLRRRHREDNVEMDITPMIDIVFLLLIFFLVCSTIGKTSPVQLPKAQHGVPINPRTSTVLMLSGMEDQCTVFLGDGTATPLPGDHELQRDEIIKAIESGLKEGMNDVVIRADRKLYHGEVARIESIASSVQGVNLFVVIEE